ncbi:MAG TPA: methyltransferase domain-containing protein [Gaiellaceae bacterium]|nr:methyltransferase domain-containing protein [Gaiellaceae bacterium]
MSEIDNVEEQYATDANLNARIELHRRFSTNPTWGRWLFEQELGGVPVEARILEIGCGPATTLWGANLERIDPTWQITLVDFSAGMVDSAREVLGDRAEYAVANAEALPFADESFDVVLANHMLYHVADRPAAFAEIRRVLVPGGLFHAATNGDGHMRELGALTDWWPPETHTREFGLESGPAQLEEFFVDIRVERFDDNLAVTEVEPVLAYLRSSWRWDGHDLAVERAGVEEGIARDGVFLIHKSQGLISARKP